MGQSYKLKRCLSLMVGSVLNTKLIPITICWRRQTQPVYLLFILPRLVGRSERIEVIMEYGSSNNRRYIDVSHIVCVLNEKQPGFTYALIGLHALTMCDFTSCFFRMGKMKPFALLEVISTPYDHAILTRWIFHFFVHCTATTHQISTREDINRSCV